MSRLAPGDPLVSFYGERVERISEVERERAMEKLGLNESIGTQYIKWIKGAIKGNFGMSFKYKQDVKLVISEVYINTILLGGIAYVLTFALALIIGIFSALHEDEFIDKVICAIGNITNCIPSFWVALVLVLIFSINLSILPTSGAYSIGKEWDLVDRIEHLILPLIVLIFSHLWYYTYMVRNKILEEIKEDYVLLCKTKGVKEKVIVYKHCLRNIMPSFVSIMAVSVPHILGGTYIVEQVFSYPGLGLLSFESAKYHDYNMLLILCLITGIVVVVANVIAEIIKIKIDPRIKHYRRDEIEF